MGVVGEHGLAAVGTDVVHQQPELGQLEGVVSLPQAPEGQAETAIEFVRSIQLPEHGGLVGGGQGGIVPHLVQDDPIPIRGGPGLQPPVFGVAAGIPFGVVSGEEGIAAGPDVAPGEDLDGPGFVGPQAGHAPLGRRGVIHQIAILLARGALVGGGERNVVRAGEEAAAGPLGIEGHGAVDDELAAVGVIGPGAVLVGGPAGEVLIGGKAVAARRLEGIALLIGHGGTAVAAACAVGLQGQQGQGVDGGGVLLHGAHQVHLL